MPETYTFRIDGDPKPQPRTRMARLPNGSLRNYDPGSAKGWKELIAIEAKKVRPAAPIQGPLSVEVVFFMRRPQGHLRKDGTLKPWAPAFCSSRGRDDVDNLFKSSSDILTQIGFWQDDGQIAIAHIEKVYANPGSRPGAQFHISVLDDRRGSR